MNKQINEMIKLYQEDKDFSGGADVSLIDQAGKELNLIVPNQYKWFLQTYGRGGL
ncbi:MAG: SMI1/KNR4 family protein [Anaerofustis sp.]